MNIDRSNYELYVVDYLDGRLEADQVAELMLFLAENPDLLTEFEMLTEGSAQDLVAEPDTMPGKEELKKSLVPAGLKDIEEKLVARLEGDLPPAEEQRLERYLHAYPGLQHEWELLRKTRLHPDLHIVYPDKASLKKKVLMPLFYRYTAVGIAASLLIAAGLYLLRPSGPDRSSSLAEGGLPQLHATNSHRAQDKLAEGTGVHHYTASAHPGPIKAAMPAHHAVNQVHKTQTASLNLRQHMLSPTRMEVALSTAAIQVKPLVVTPAPREEEFKTIEEIISAKVHELDDDVLKEENVGGRKAGKRLADLSALAVRTVNKVSGSTLRLKRKYDNSGNVIGYGIASANFEFYNGK